MNSLRDIVPRMIKNLGLSQRYKAELILLNWRQIVGEEIAANTRPGKISRRVMILSAKNAVWAHHLSTLKEEIIARINSYAGEKAVTDLKFQAGYFRNDQNNEENGDGDETPVISWREVTIDTRDKKAIDEIAAPLADDLLRGKVKRLLDKEMALRKARQRHNWQPCRQCGVLRPPGDELCSTCALAARAAARDAVRRLLRDAPWLGYEECSRYVACRRSDFKTARDGLADTLARSVARDEEDRLGLALLTMLLFGVRPGEMTEEMTAKTLAIVRRKSDVSASRR
jgi:predicted nucleic acid-binding Zn ribbon protein